MVKSLLLTTLLATAVRDVAAGSHGGGYPGKSSSKYIQVLHYSTDTCTPGTLVSRQMAPCGLQMYSDMFKGMMAAAIPDYAKVIGTGNTCDGKTQQSTVLLEGNDGEVTLAEGMLKMHSGAVNGGEGVCDGRTCVNKQICSCIDLPLAAQAAEYDVFMGPDCNPAQTMFTNFMAGIDDYAELQDATKKHPGTGQKTHCDVDTGYWMVYECPATLMVGGACLGTPKDHKLLYTIKDKEECHNAQEETASYKLTNGLPCTGRKAIAGLDRMDFERRTEYHGSCEGHKGTATVTAMAPMVFTHTGQAWGVAPVGFVAAGGSCKGTDRETILFTQDGKEMKAGVAPCDGKCAKNAAGVFEKCECVDFAADRTFKMDVWVGAGCKGNPVMTNYVAGIEECEGYPCSPSVCQVDAKVDSQGQTWVCNDDGEWKGYLHKKVENGVCMDEKPYLQYTINDDTTCHDARPGSVPMMSYKSVNTQKCKPDSEKNIPVKTASGSYPGNSPGLLALAGGAAALLAI